jgi:dihydrofolate reductase
VSRIIVTQFQSVDGVGENPHEWSLSYMNDAIMKFKHEELFAARAMLLGRVTYDTFAASWPSRTGDAFADRFNSLPKLVASRTLRNPTWNASKVLNGDVPAEVSRLRKEPGADILVYGSLTLVVGLMQRDLVDEYRLLVYPVVLGKGRRLFQDGSHAKLSLVDHEALGSGAVLLKYAPAG